MEFGEIKDVVRARQTETTAGYWEYGKKKAISGQFYRNTFLSSLICLKNGG